MNLNDWLTQVFHDWSLPEVSSYVAFWAGMPFAILSVWLSWLSWKTKQNVQIVRVADALPEAKDLVDFLVKKARDVGDFRLANYLLAYKLAGNVGSETKLQECGIRYLTEVTKETSPNVHKELDKLNEAFYIMM